MAATKASAQIAQQLVEAGASANAQPRKGRLTPLHMAVLRAAREPGALVQDTVASRIREANANVLRCMAVLLAHGAVVDLVSEDGLTPLARAVYRRALGAVTLLLKHGATPLAACVASAVSAAGEPAVTDALRGQGFDVLQALPVASTLGEFMIAGRPEPFVLPEPPLLRPAEGSGRRTRPRNRAARHFPSQTSLRLSWTSGAMHSPPPGTVDDLGYPSGSVVSTCALTTGDDAETQELLVGHGDGRVTQHALHSAQHLLPRTVAELSHDSTVLALGFVRQGQAAVSVSADTVVVRSPGQPAVRLPVARLVQHMSQRRVQPSGRAVLVLSGWSHARRTRAIQDALEQQGFQVHVACMVRQETEAMLLAESVLAIVACLPEPYWQQIAQHDAQPVEGDWKRALLHRGICGRCAADAVPVVAVVDADLSAPSGHVFHDRPLVWPAADPDTQLAVAFELCERLRKRTEPAADDDTKPPVGLASHALVVPDADVVVLAVDSQWLGVWRVGRPDARADWVLEPVGSLWLAPAAVVALSGHGGAPFSVCAALGHRLTPFVIFTSDGQPAVAPVCPWRSVSSRITSLLHTPTMLVSGHAGGEIVFWRFSRRNQTLVHTHRAYGSTTRGAVRHLDWLDEQVLVSVAHNAATAATVLSLHDTATGHHLGVFFKAVGARGRVLAARGASWTGGCALVLPDASIEVVSLSVSQPALPHTLSVMPLSGLAWTSSHELWTFTPKLALGTSVGAARGGRGRRAPPRVDTEGASCFAVHQDRRGHFVAVARQAQLELWVFPRNGVHWKRTLSLSAPATALAVCTAECLLVCTQDGQCAMVGLDSEAALGPGPVRPGSSEPLVHLALHASSRSIVAASAGSQLWCWPLKPEGCSTWPEGSRLLAACLQGRRITAMATSGSWLVAATQSPGLPPLMLVATLAPGPECQLVCVTVCPAPVSHVAVSRHMVWYTTQAPDLKLVCQWLPCTQQAPATAVVQLPGPCTGLALSPNGQFLACALATVVNMVPVPHPFCPSLHEPMLAEWLQQLEHHQATLTSNAPISRALQDPRTYVLGYLRADVDEQDRPVRVLGQLMRLLRHQPRLLSRLLHHLLLVQPTALTLDLRGYSTSGSTDTDERTLLGWAVKQREPGLVQAVLDRVVRSVREFDQVREDNLPIKTTRFAAAPDIFDSPRWTADVVELVEVYPAWAAAFLRKLGTIRAPDHVGGGHRVFRLHTSAVLEAQIPRRVHELLVAGGPDAAPYGLWGQHLVAAGPDRRPLPDYTYIEPHGSRARPEPVQARTVPFKQPAQLLQAVVKVHDASLCNNPTVRATTCFLWHAFGRQRFTREVLWYLLSLVLLTVTAAVTTGYHRFSAESDDARDGVTVACLALLVLLMGRSWWHAVYLWGTFCDHLRDSTPHAHRYRRLFSLVWWWNDAVCTVTLLGSVVGFAAGWGGYRVFLAVLIVFRWIGLGFYMQAHHLTGPFVRMSVEITSDMRWFLMLLLVAIVSVASAFYLLLHNQSDGVDGFDQWPQALFTTFRMLLLGDFDSDSLLLGPYDGLVYLLFVVGMFMTLIVLLNLLIALMGGSYGRVEGNADNEFVLMRASMLLNYLQHLPECKREAKVFMGVPWLHVLQGLTPSDDNGEEEEQGEEEEEEKGQEENSGTEAKRNGGIDGAGVPQPWMGAGDVQRGLANTWAGDVRADNPFVSKANYS